MNASDVLPSLPHQARVLLIRLRSIGDIVLMTPALRLLKAWRPDLRVSVMVEPPFLELLRGNPDVEEVLEPGGGRGAGKLVARIGALRAIRSRGFELCVNLHGGPTSLWLTRLSGVRVKAAFAHFRSSGAYDFLIPDARRILGIENVHTAEHHAAAFFYLGLPRREIPRARLFVSPVDREWWRGAQQSLGLKPAADYAVVHPAALYATKAWAAEKFAQLGQWLEREHGLRVIFACGPNESAFLDAVERESGSKIRRLEGTSLGQFAAVLAGARLFVGNDSGPAHMAAALARPSVVIFGSSSSRIWGPWPRPVPDGSGPRESSTRLARVVQNPYDCNPCPGDRCYRYDRPECILSVTLEQVEAAVDAVLGAPVADGSDDTR
jgi:lipopolysaccharide heptosyltransferase III